jgi:hypothetical protein
MSRKSSTDDYGFKACTYCTNVCLWISVTPRPSKHVCMRLIGEAGTGVPNEIPGCMGVAWKKNSCS